MPDKAASISRLAAFSSFQALDGPIQRVVGARLLWGLRCRHGEINSVYIASNTPIFRGVKVQAVHYHNAKNELHNLK